MKPYSLRRQLVALMVAALGAALSAIAIFLYIGVRDAAWQQHDEGLLARARALSALAEHDDEGYELEAVEIKGAFIELRLPDGKSIRRGAPLTIGPNPHGFVDLELPDGRRGRAVALRFMPRDEDGKAQELTLVLAEGVTDVTRSIAAIRNLFVLVSVIAMLVIAALVWWITGTALRPLERLGRAAETIDDKTLTTRLPEDNQPIELVAPVKKLNDLLGRLETSFARERQFTADVSHELRTPLAGLRTVLEVTALADRDTAEYKRAIADAHAIVLQLGALVDNLLMLARLDAGQLPTVATDVQLRELVEECWKPHAQAAAARGLTFKNQLGDTTAHVDREKLRVIVSNVLANAAEYTEQGGWIEVTGDGALIAVSDSGPALPDTAKIFDRLWRGDTARTATGVHCGIGLALGKSLAEHMQLRLSAENRPDGSVRFAIASLGSAGARSSA